MNVLNKLFHKSLTLQVAGHEVTFNTVAEFEFALAGRTDVPARKMAELVALTPAELKDEAQNIKKIEQQFVDLLSRSIEDPNTIGEALRSIDPHIFSQDHHWRDIIASLNEKSADYDELKRIGLVKYMQYLRSRQDLIKQIYKVKKRDAERRGGAAERPRDGTDGGGKAGFKETVIFDTVLIEEEADPTSPFTRLPKGEPVLVAIGADTETELRLSKHVFALRRSAGLLEIIDDRGHSQTLQPGKNIIGRDSVCNIVIDNAYRDVSRIHLLVEPLESGQVRFTDLSSHGTFLATRLLHAA